MKSSFIKPNAPKNDYVPKKEPIDAVVAVIVSWNYIASSKLSNCRLQVHMHQMLQFNGELGLI